MSSAVDLQFDRAEFTAAGSACTFCQAPISGSYFQVNGRMACEACRYRAVDPALTGSSAGRFVRAAFAGSAAAIAGALLYYGISAVTGYEFGLIAIVVGVGVGTAVRWGCRGRGGWRYQALAMVLTYLAIVATYVPPIVRMIREDAAKRAVTAPASVESAGSQQVDAEPPPSFGRFVASMAMLVLLICGLPFLAGLENIMGIVIIGIGLYEAWKLNRRIPLVVTGPHVINTAAVMAE